MPAGNIGFLVPSKDVSPSVTVQTPYNKFWLSGAVQTGLSDSCMHSLRFPTWYEAHKAGWPANGRNLEKCRDTFVRSLSFFTFCLSGSLTNFIVEMRAMILMLFNTIFPFSAWSKNLTKQAINKHLPSPPPKKPQLTGTWTVHFSKGTLLARVLPQTLKVVV